MRPRPIRRRFSIPTTPLALSSVALSMSGCSLFGERIMGEWKLTDWEYSGYDASDAREYLTAEATLDFDDKDGSSIEGELDVEIEITYDYGYSYDYDYDYGAPGDPEPEPARIATRSNTQVIEFSTNVEADPEDGKEYEIEVDGYRGIDDTSWECEIDGDELICEGDEGIDTVWERQ